MLRAYFSFDDFMHLNNYVKTPLLQLLQENLSFWTSYPRPLGGTVYRLLFECFGLNPLPYYLTSLILFLINLALLFYLILRLTKKPWATAVVTAVGSVHGLLAYIWFDFGTIFELLAFCAMLTSFHLYLSYLESPISRTSLYVLSLLSFVAALNGKEMAVTLPALLMLYEVVYRFQKRGIWNQIRGLAIRLAPFAVVALLYALGKLSGESAFWRFNTEYQYQLDSTAYHNLHIYLSSLTYDNIHFDDALLAWTLLLSVALAFVLKSREMLFGWFYFLVALAPIIALPRIGGFFLYIPLPGLALYLTFLVREVGALIYVRLPKRITPSDWVLNGVLAVLLLVMGFVHYPQTQSSIPTIFHNLRSEWRTFTAAMGQQYPDLPSNTAIIVEGAPLREWALPFFVWLHYGDRSIRIFHSPEGRQEFHKAARRAPEVHSLRFDPEIGLIESLPLENQAETQ
jgi:hypothetical protein